jgi:hypothetical protein
MPEESIAPWNTEPEMWKAFCVACKFADHKRARYHYAEFMHIRLHYLWFREGFIAGGKHE